MLERDGKAAEALRQHAKSLPAPAVEVLQMDALSYLQRGDETFDVIFLDPPFSMDLLGPALHSAATRLKPGGKIYAESPRFLEQEAFEILRQGRAGLSHYYLLEPV